MPDPVRKRMKRWETAGDIRFVTFSTYRRTPLLTVEPTVAEKFLEQLGVVRRQAACAMYGYVVMPEHVHLMLRPSATPIAQVLHALKSRVARAQLHAWRTSEPTQLASMVASNGSARLWQRGGGFDRNVRTLDEFCREIRYMHENPVRRGLVREAHEWPWSSVHWWMGDTTRSISCDPPPSADRMDWRSWRGFMRACS